MAIASFKKASRKPERDVWQEFFSDALLKKHRVTDAELEILKEFSPLGVVICLRDVLFILETIRWSNRTQRA